jgi:poly-beta-1,6-N-acetyl-D-glucosamine biosynthesis protein PgaD
MSNNLIINARNSLSWHQRLFSDTTTAVAWGGWLFLWRPILATVGALSSWSATLPNMLVKLLGGTSPADIVYSLVAVVGGSGTLLLWNHLVPARKADSHRVQVLRDYAAHFQLPEQTILAGRVSTVSVVHHDEHGRIIGIETRDATMVEARAA